MKKTFIALLTLAMTLVASAQEMYMPYERVSESTDAWLGGKAGLSIVSPHNDLVVVVIPADSLDVVSKAVTEGDKYRYDISLNVADGESSAKREFKVSRQGKSVTIKFKEQIAVNRRVVYNVEEVATPIMIQETRKGLGSTSGDMACVEINTPIDLDVACGAHLDKSIKTSSNNATGTKTITIDINRTKLVESATAYLNAKAEYDDLNAKDYNLLSDTQFDRIKELEDNILPPLQKEYQDLTTIELKGSGTNTCNISIGDDSGITLGVKERQSYVVLLMKETVYETEYTTLINKAWEQEEQLHFTSAQEYYSQAMNASGKPEGADAELLSSIASMEELADLNKRAVGAMKKFNDINKSAKESEILELLYAALDCYRKIAEMTQLDLAKKRTQQIENRLDKMPWVVEGYVRAGHMHGGVLQQEEVEGCVVYYKDSDGILHHIGTTDKNGKYHVQLSRASIGALVFEWNKKKDDKYIRSHTINFGMADKDHITWDVNFYK